MFDTICKSVIIYMLRTVYSDCNPPMTARVKISQNVDTCQGISSALNPPVTTRVKISQNVDTCQGISSALKSRTLSNLMCSKYILVTTIFDW